MKKLLLFLGLLFAAALAVQGQTWQIGGTNGTPIFSFSCSPLTLSFSNTTVGATSGALNSTCTNTGNQTLAVTTEILTGATFALGGGNTCAAAFSILPAGTCLVSVTFTPSSATTFTGTVVVTITGATGSPQTVNLSGTGVTSGGGGSAYTAPQSTSAVIGYTGYSPLTSGNLCAEGGTVCTDTNFVHTSSGGISSSTADAFFQCAGSSAATTAHGLWSGFPTNASWRTNNTTHAHIFTPDDNWIVLGSSASAFGFFQITFTSSAKCVLRELISPVNAVLQPGTDGPVASHTGGADASLFYTWTTANPGLATINFSGGAPGVITTLVPNLNVLSPAPCGITIGNGSNQFGYLHSTNDNTTLGHDNVVMWVTGTAAEAQNTWECLVFYQRSSGAVAWWDSLTDACGSTTSPAWTGGWKSVSSGCTGQPSGRMHGLEEPDVTGTYVGIDDQQGSTQCFLVFNMTNQTGTCLTAPTVANNGHICSAVGPNMVTFATGSNPSVGAMNAAAFTAPSVLAFTAGRLGTAVSGGTLQTDQHCDASTVNSTSNSGTIHSLSYTQASQCPGGTSPCPQPSGIGQQEGIAVSPPPSSGTWTPTFYRFFHSMTDCVTDTNFFCLVGGNVSGDGSMHAVTTNWGATLGNTPAGTPREVVVVHELR